MRVIQDGQGDDFAVVRALIAGEASHEGDAEGTAGALQVLCRAAAGALPASGAGVSLVVDGGAPGAAAWSDPTSALLEELQFTLGEGPCIDAHATRRPVLMPVLEGEASTRWPGYVPAVRQHGVRAVFAFPLQVGAASLGVLDVYRTQAGALSAPAIRQALTFAEIAVRTLLEGQDGAPEGESAQGLDDTMGYLSELHQAQGMVMVQLGVTLAEAMARLRAYAFASERRLGDVARDVVSRRLNLEQDDA